MTVEERLAAHLSQTPDTSRAIWVAPNATVVGDVTLGPKSSVFYGAVLRGDIARIVVGEGTNIQDNWPTISTRPSETGVRSAMPRSSMPARSRTNV
jgi:carbonic anhydrase/acetyltransferase-like protein (isoleucine patch superfamily)